MIELINKMTGTSMYVPDDRVEEYKKLGHKEKANKKKRKSKLCKGVI